MGRWSCSFSCLWGAISPQRHTITLGLLSLFLVSGCGGGGNGGSTNDPGYALVELGTVASFAVPFAINNTGEAVTTRSVRLSDGTSAPHASRLVNSVWQDIHPPGSDIASVGVDINARGQILIYTVNSRDLGSDASPYRAYLLDNGTYTEILSGLPNVFAVFPTALAPDGTAIGSYSESGTSPGEFTRKAFSWKNGVMTTLPGYSEFGINGVGQIIGASSFVGRPLFMGTLRQADGQIIALTTLQANAVNVLPSAINDAGVIVGGASPDIMEAQHPCVIRNGKVEYLLSPEQGMANSINTQGEIVGAATTTGPFLRKSDGAIVRFRSLFPLGSQQFTLSDINDRSEIAGSYQDSSGKRQGFLLRPRALIPPSGQASVTLSNVNSTVVDSSPFTLSSSTGVLTGTNNLLATVAAKENSHGLRNFTVTLFRSADSIEIGKSYPITTPAGGNPNGGGMNYVDAIKDSTGAYTNHLFFATGGTIVVDSITATQVRLRLINVSLKSLVGDFGTVTLNATVTFPR